MLNKINLNVDRRTVRQVLKKDAWGSGCTDPHILDLGTSWRLVVSFTPRSIYPQGKSHRYPLDRRLGGP
jgi:hypothetical protein